MINKYTVKLIPFWRIKEWVVKKHYARRIPSISYSFGIYETEKVYDYLRGVACFGIPVTHFSNVPNWFQILEFNRLIMEEPHEKNLTSWFIGKIIKDFPIKPVLLVSYADMNMGHHGYIYQATNWVYTGTSSSDGRGMMVDEEGKIFHAKTLYNKYGTSSPEKLAEKGLNIKKSQNDTLIKHRYFLPIGNKKEKKEIMNWLKTKYKFLPYPKGDNSKYDASFKPNSKIGFGFI